MNKSAIRNFAVWARNKLITDVSYRAGLMGVTVEGIAKALPQSTDNVEFYDIGMAEPYSITGNAINQRKALAETISRKAADSDYKTAYTSVMEEVAYTWFNRLIAVRFMEVNDYLPSHVRVLSSDSGKAEPDLVTTPFDAELNLSESEAQLVLQLKQENKTDELFNLLFIKQCNQLNGILPRLFERTHDYSELLLNLSFIDREGVVYHLVNDIPEEDFDIERGGQVEIIGWLYQFYNTERNEQVYDGRFSKDRISKELLPAATTIYTPDWAVRYMVENSLGRLWAEGHSSEELMANWKYYLGEVEQEPEVQEQLANIRKEYSALNPEELRVIDPCMGSGHILVYAFDVLMQIYESAGYSQRDAAKSILEHNLYGLDIDDRAAQLSYFAVMMKARQYNRRILNGETNCHVYAIQESNGFDRSALIKLGELRPLGEKLVDTFHDAKEYGSILNVNLTMNQLDALDAQLDNVDRMSDYGSLFDMFQSEQLMQHFAPLVTQAKAMVQMYHVVFTNPPYLGSSRFSTKLDKYVKDNYPDEKYDLSMVVYRAALDNYILPNCFSAFITTSSWMFLGSFERLREKIIGSSSIASLVDFGTELFEGKVGHNPIVSWISRKSRVEYKMKAIRLVDYCYSKRNEKEREFFNPKNHYVAVQSNFSKIPGIPFAYWVSNELVNAYSHSKIKDKGFARSGLQTGNNDLFLKCWYEVVVEDIAFNMHSKTEYLASNKKWTPQIKGGAYRKWYGNFDYVVNLEDDGREIRACDGSRLNAMGNDDLFFKKGLTWSHTTSSIYGARYLPCGHLFNVEAPTFFPVSIDEEYALAMLNSCVIQYCLNATNATMHYLVGNIMELPVIESPKELSHIKALSSDNISMARADWDSFETSWDFKKHPLI